MGNKVLIAPLDWGLGHATRCIPVIRRLLENNIEVIIAGNGNSLQLLRLEFPLLRYIELPGYNVTYAVNKYLLPVKILIQLPKLLFAVFKEHQQLKKIIAEHNINVVISDNRYGFWNNKIHTVFITHQLKIKTSFLRLFTENAAYLLNSFFIRKFNECWVPDYPGENNLSDELSHLNTSLNLQFIGPLSRFKRCDNPGKKHDVIAIISGPEPQRSIFEEIIIKQLEATNLKALIVLGKPGANKTEQLNAKVNIVSHLSSGELNEAICASKVVVSRAGYSTIMDLAVLGKKAILIPTPGQTEQEYLAEYFKKQQIFYTVSQDEFNLRVALEEVKKYSGIQYNNTEVLLDKAIESLFSND